MEERELVKIASDNPAYPQGYYTQFKDAMRPGDVIFGQTPIIKEAKPAGDETDAPGKPANKRKVKK